MFKLPDSLVSTEWLQGNLGKPGLMVADVRGYVKSRAIGGGKQVADYLPALDEYQKAHIPGAVFIDWTADIINPDDPVKVQIAPPERFKQTMEERGIGDETAVVVVDHAGGHFATRLWWALRYYGHDSVAVLDGGFNKWAMEGRPLTDIVPTPAPETFTPRMRPSIRSTWAEVRDAIDSPTDVIVDAREAETYRGEVWRGSRKGHIPSAINLSAKALVNADSTWKSPAELQAIADSSGLNRSSKTIAYCNGGVTATAVLFALHRLGNDNYANYDGSWNEWGERSDLPVEEG